MLKSVFNSVIKNKKIALLFNTGFLVFLGVIVSVASFIGCGGNTGYQGGYVGGNGQQSTSQSTLGHVKSIARNNKIELQQNNQMMPTSLKKETSFLSKNNDTLRIIGSDTMVHLVTAWAEAYQNKHTDLSIAVSGGGSGNGIAALLNGTNDIAPASREMEANEIKLFKKQKHSYTAVKVAQDGIAIIVNSHNPIRVLSKTELADIFEGRKTTWNQVSDKLPNKQIILFSRESSSGTYKFFQEFILKKQDFALSARLIPSSSSITESVSQDEWSIGYVGLGFVKEAMGRVKVIPVQKDPASKAILPSIVTILSGQYPISRALYLYVDGKALQKASKFITFCKSQQGQFIVQNAGFVPL